jgi:hypothetical protein
MNGHIFNQFHPIWMKELDVEYKDTRRVSVVVP